LNVNGEPLQSQIDINRQLLLRDVNDIEVQHANGTIESLLMPEDIGQQLFQSGNLQPFSPVRKPVIDSVIPDSPAERAGLTKGIIITAINGEKVTYWHEFRRKVKATEGQAFDISFISTAGENQELDVEGSGTVNITTNEKGDIGVYTSAFSRKDILTRTYTFGESIPAGFDFAYWTLNDYVSQFKYVFTKKGATQVGGFGAIGSLFPDTWDWQSFWTTTAFISIILAFMNILPIPALDGGHVVFLLYEMISGRKPNEKVMEYAQIVGFFILIALVLFANGNDVYRWITGD
jgi:regulator of sigma E protease